MSELKAKRHIDEDTGIVFSFYDTSEADKVIESLTEGAMSMFREPNRCRGLDVKSPLGRIANVAFKHWMHVEHIQNKNIQLQEDKDRLLLYNHNLLNEVEALKARIAEKDMEIRSLKRALYKACANWAHTAVAFFSPYVIKNRWRWMELKCLKKAEEHK